MKRSLGIAAALLGLLTGTARAQEVVVFAAASLRAPVLELATLYRKKKGVTVLPSFAASDLLARQVAAGAPAHVLLTADKKPLDDLQQRGLLKPKAARHFLLNHLVVAGTRKKNLPDLKALTGASVRSLVIADPTIAPLGRYSRKALQQAGLWAALQPRLRIAQDAKAAVAALAASGKDTLGIVYETDALATPRVHVLLVLASPAAHYFKALLPRGQNSAIATTFFRFLTDPAARAVWQRHGFTPTP